MKRKINFILILLILNLSLISSACEEGQIDINSASLIELDKLPGIGEVKAQAIIDARPYNSVDELTNAWGVGEVTLENIKASGLACVSLSEGYEEEIIEEIEDEKEEVVYIKPEETKEPEIIVLNPQVIKSGNTKEKLNKNNYAIYGLTGFCILLGVLFIFRKKQLNKNEFG